MKIQKKWSVIIGMTCSGLLLACGGGGSSSSDSDTDTTTTTYQGTFIDDPVKGLYYESTSNSGCTDSDGHFTYTSGETITFSLGKCDSDNNVISSDSNKIVIGSSTAGEVLTPYSLSITSGDDEGESVSATSLARLLQSLNTDSGGSILDVTGIEFIDSDDTSIITAIEQVLASTDSSEFDTYMTDSVFTSLQALNDEMIETDFVSASDALSALSEALASTDEDSDSGISTCAVWATTGGVSSSFCFSNYDSYYDSPEEACTTDYLEAEQDPDGTVTYTSTSYSTTATCAEQGFPYYGASDTWWDDADLAAAQAAAQSE